MGNHMTHKVRHRAGNHASEPPLVPLISWLDPASAAGVRDIVRSVAAHHIEVQAVILFGSVARHEERPLSDPEPSDVDLLLIIDPTLLDPTADRLSNERELALTHTIGMADYRHRSPREINTFFMNRDLARWDSRRHSAVGTWTLASAHRLCRRARDQFPFVRGPSLGGGTTGIPCSSQHAASASARMSAWTCSS